ncbi:uncharacterized protein LOC108477470 [Gossypium arboreum]|uniref:uncharacterized protein LOC108477470 n=1 Tax=Gossypium arboreum TaxID=29729 RepID=UPI0008195FFD|nr:uncharacterized protein LOC108477470 [Gossypium arboreum]
MATTYHPQTNRQVKNILENFVNPSRKDWYSQLDDALWALRIAYKTRLGMLLYQLVYRKACHLPVELEHKAMWAIKQVNRDYEVVGKKRLLDITKLEEIRRNAYENVAIYKEKTKRWHDKIILRQ